MENSRKRLSSAADWLALAAAPSFAVMALLVAAIGGGATAMICAAGPEPGMLGGMVPMYLLMAGLHLAPWLRLAAARRRRTP